MWTIILIAVLTSLVLYYVLQYNSDGYPPGPFRLPILGNLHQVFLAGSIVEFCKHNSKRFGNVSI